MHKEKCACSVACNTGAHIRFAQGDAVFLACSSAVEVLHRGQDAHACAHPPSPPPQKARCKTHGLVRVIHHATKTNENKHRLCWRATAFQGVNNTQRLCCPQPRQCSNHRLLAHRCAAPWIPVAYPVHMIIQVRWGT